MTRLFYPLATLFLFAGNLMAQNNNVPLVAIGRYYPMSVHEPYENDSIYYFYDAMGRKTGEVHKDKEDGYIRHSYTWEYLPDEDHVKKTQLVRWGSTFSTSIFESIVLRDDQQRVISIEQRYTYQGPYASSFGRSLKEYQYNSDSVLIMAYNWSDADSAYTRLSVIEIYSDPDFGNPGFQRYVRYSNVNDTLKLVKSMSNVKYALFDLIHPELNIILSGKEYLPNEELHDRYYEATYSDTAYDCRVMTHYDTSLIVCGYKKIRWDNKHRVIYTESKSYQDFYPEAMAWGEVDGNSNLYEYEGDRLVHQVNRFKHELYADMIVYSELYYTSFSSVGIGKVENKPIGLSPNPATDQLNLSGVKSESDFVILDIQGKLVARGKIKDRSSISIGFLQPGTYFLQIALSGQVLVEKFVKE